MSKKNGTRSALAEPSRLKPFDADDKELLRVVIETPKGSRNKFAFDPDEHIFELKKVLPYQAEPDPEAPDRPCAPLRGHCHATGHAHTAPI
jgi:hypothetical protein